MRIKPILFIDLETTGLSKFDQPIEIGAVFTHHDKILSSFESKINIDYNITEIKLGACKVNRVLPSSLINGRTGAKDVVEVGKNLGDFLTECTRLCDGEQILIGGHNVNFDIRHTNDILETAHIVGLSEITSHKVVDTAVLGQFLVNAGIIKSSSSSLHSLALALDIPIQHEALHTALYDAELSFQVYNIMLSLVKELSI